MGAPINGEILKLKELNKHKFTLAERVRQTYLQKLESLKSELNGNCLPADLRIKSSGIEIECTAVKDNFPLKSINDVETILSHDHDLVGPEFLDYIIEGKTPLEDLFSLEDSFSEVKTRIDQNILSAIDSAIKELGGKIVLLGCLPTHNYEQGRQHITEKPRYQLLDQLLTPLSQPTEIHYLDGSKTITGKGMAWQGFCSLQTTVKVPLSAIDYFFDAAYLLETVFLAISTSSPFIDGKLTIYDSSRVHLIPPVIYGFPQEDYDRSREGRWRTDGPLTMKQNLTKWADGELYHKLRDRGFNESLARHCAESAGDGILVVTEKEFEDPSKPLYPTSWPNVKLHWDKANEEGILLELRMGEMPAPPDISHFVSTKNALLQGLAQEIYFGNIDPLPKEKIDYNLGQAKFYAPIEKKKMYFPLPSKTKTMKNSLTDIFHYLGKLAVRELKRDGHQDSEIREIINPVLNKAGVMYMERGDFIQIAAEPHPAELMRRIAYREQPSIKKGERLYPETLSAIMQPFTCK